MAGEWLEWSLSKLCSYINRGSAPAYVDTGGVLVLNQKCVRDQRVSFLEARRTDHERKSIVAERLLRPLDILVNSTGVGTLGRVAQIRDLPEPATVDSHVTIVRPDPEVIDPRYLGFALRLFEREIEVLGEGSTGQTELARTRLAAFTVPVAPENEQRAIAHILGTLDDKIELNRRMNETLEAMARALFKSWFVDFDPVRAKAERRDPGLPKPLADLFPDSFEDSELGVIPKGWKMGRFGDVVEQLRDQENPLSSPDALFHHYSLPAFDDGQTPKLELGESIKSHKSRVPSGAILLSKLNPEIERVWMVDVRPDERAVCSTEFLVLRGRPPFGRNYAYCFARSPVFRQQIEGLVTGTSKSHQRAQVGSILDIEVVVPQAPLIAAFERSAAGLLERTFICRHEARSLAALRDALLPKLVSGELQVTDAERIVGRCA